MTDVMKIPRTGTLGFLFRFAVSFVVATVFVVSVVALGVNFHAEEEEEEPGALPDLSEVTMISVKDNPDLQRMIRESRGEPVDPLRELPEPVKQPERQVQGFVQLEYTINPDGSISDVRVVGAAPSGVFEERAVQRLQQSMRAPIYEDGEPVTRRTTEIIEFSVPVSEMQAGEPQDAGSDSN